MFSLSFLCSGTLSSQVSGSEPMYRDKDNNRDRDRSRNRDRENHKIIQIKYAINANEICSGTTAEMCEYK